jgi:hypothetical protein
MNIEIKNELIERQSTLSQLDKQYFAPTTDIPAGYFEGMEDAFFAKMREENAPKASTSINMWDKTRVNYAIAAVSVFAIVGVALFSIVRTDKVSSLSQNEVVNYLQEEDELTENMPPIKVDETVKIEELTNEEIKNYLLENEDIDITNIN